MHSVIAGDPRRGARIPPLSEIFATLFATAQNGTKHLCNLLGWRVPTIWAARHDFLLFKDFL